MSLALDARQRAMLAEMGIRLFDAPAPAAAPDLPPVRATPVAPPAPRAAPSVSPPAARALVPSGSPSRGGAETLAVEAMDWEALTAAVSACRACGLCEGRRNVVPGAGDRHADWLIVGDAPSEEEDLQGDPFVGAAGPLLDNMLRAVGLDRTRGVYLTHLLKCRPPGNRNPDAAEIAQCEPYLRRQVALIQPRVILLVGRLAIQALLQTAEPMGKLRGRAHAYQGVPVVVTYPPGHLLRNLPDKAKAWADLCLAMDLVERAPPSS